MPQWQFKLFEFDIIDSYPHDREEYQRGRDNKKFIVQMFGIDTQGKTASIFVTGFDPFFYVKVPDDWNDSNVMEFTNFVKGKMGHFYEDALVKPRLLKRQKLYGFDNKKLHNFIKFKFKNMNAFNKAKNIWYKDNSTPTQFSRTLIDGGIEYGDERLELYEAQIPPLLRLFHIQEISPSGWIALQNNRFTEHKKKTTTCDYEFSVKYSDIVGLSKREANVPYKIMSVDIEASSSHGDFPLPKKNYKKLATNIIDILQEKNITPDNNLLAEYLYSAFKNSNLEYRSKGIDIVYPKKEPTIEELELLIEKWVNTCPAKYAKMKFEEELKNQLMEEKGNEDDDENEDIACAEDEKSGIMEEKETFYAFKFNKRAPKKYTKKEATILDMLLDSEAERDTKIQGLADTLTAIFPELKGDEVTFIGTSFRRNGEIKPYLKHCIVVGDCNEIDGAEVECYNTEREALLAWTALMQREDPDIVIGYNVHGWDYGFMYERSQELNCVKQFLRLSRNKNEVCLKQDWKTKRETIEESTLVIASGQYDLKYYKMTGRLQIDFLNLFRREEQLPSYKLDYVSGHFIGDDIKDIEYNRENDYTIIKTKNLIGVENGDYIVIEEIGHTTDLYDNGKKMKISNLYEKGGTFTVAGNISPDKSKKLRWCLGKDDVTPQDIFRLANEGPEGRAIVGKYCIKDTTLIHDLMRKVDTMTGYIEMAKLCWVPMSFLVYRGQGIKLTSYVAQKCREKNTLMPVIEKNFDDEGYEGACVLTPVTGLYLEDPVACVDYSSLYPSSIISENLSHDSKLWTKEYDMEDNLIETWYSVEDMENPPEGYDYVDVTYDTFKWIRKTPKAAKTKEKCGYKTCRFVQFPDDEKAILPAILIELLGARKATKKLAAKEEDPFMANVYDKRQLAIKVTANSLYGQTGAKTSTFFEKDVAASTTATGRKLLMYAKSVIENNFGDRVIETKKDGKVKTKAKTVYGDSIAGDTPVYIRINKEKIDICTVEELANKYGNSKWELCEEDGKEDKLVCELKNIESWSEIGWTKCHRIIKHELAPEKKMLRILTHTGMVDVTDDHSLVKNTGEMISPKEVEIGTKLLHKTMEINDVNSNISIEEAKIMGFFFGDGSCGSYNCKSGSKSSWALNNSDSNLLNKYLDLCKIVYPEFEWKIYDTIKTSGVNKLTFTVKNRGNKVKFIKRYRDELYNNNSKKIPENILNSNREIREAFWEGLYDADGDKDKNGYTRIDQKSQLSASHICWLANSIGYKTSINIRNDKQNIYRITATKNYQRKDPNMVKKIVELDRSRDLKGDTPFTLEVYDLTTANHHFAAGIGNMIVHNTDSVFFNLNLHDMDGNKITGKKALELTIEISQHVSEEANKGLKKPHDLEYEKTFLPFCLLSKKRYVGMLYEFDVNKCKRKSMGIVLKRRDNANIVKDIYGGVIDILMKEQVVYKAIDFVKANLQDVVDEKYPIEKLTVTKSLRSYYKNPMQIAHNVLAKRMGERDSGNKPGPGDRIPFAFIKTENKKALQGEKIEHPKYIIENNLQLDYGHYITNQIMKPLQQLFALPAVLESMSDFKKSRGIQDVNKPHGSWKKELDKLSEKWEDEEKLKKKVEEFRCKEVKNILFEPYIKMVK